MFKKVVTAVEVLALACAVVFVVLLFVDRAPGTKTVAASAPNPYGSSGSSSPTTVASGVDGRAVYANNCARCHGTTGQGGVGPKLSAPALKKQFADIRTQVLFVSQGAGVMPAFGTTLSPAEIQAVVEYTRTLNP